MRIPSSLLFILTFATSGAAPARAQTIGVGTARIEAAGGVEIGRDPKTRPIATDVGVTFALSAQSNGALAVSMPGFIAAGQAKGAYGLLLLADGAEQFLTGTNLAFETLSVSVNRPFVSGASQIRPGGVAVVLAQYN